MQQNIILTIAFLDQDSKRIGSTVHLGVLLSKSQDVFETAQSHLDYLAVHDGEEVAERRNATLLNEKPDLVGRAARRRIGDCPCRLLTGLEFRLAEDFDERRENIRIDHRLCNKTQTTSFIQ